jgi:hypothetical protein
VAEASVLRTLVFIGSERRKDLNAGNNLLMDGFGEGLNVLKDAIDAEPDAEAFMGGVDMNVGGIEFLSPFNEGLNDLND